MDPLAKEYIIEFYAKNLLIAGNRPQALRWSPDGQAQRYGLMAQMASPLDGARVLDYGCGKGDFYAYLKARGVGVSYVGMDITPQFIELARTEHEGVDFRVFDVELEDLNEEFDYIFLCGVFNNKVQGVDEAMRNITARLFLHARKGLIINALSSHCKVKSPELRYTSPEEFMAYVIDNITPYISLRHDAVEGDFTMLLSPALRPAES